MKSFTIKKLDKDLEIESFECDINGFIYKPKNKNYNVKEIIIVNPEITNALISYSFYKKYKKILEIYLKALQDSENADSEDGLLIALDEVSRLKTIINNKYKILLKKKEADKFLKQLKILEQEIKNKIVDLKLIKEQQLANTNIIEEKRGMGR